jgi:antitoxin FitA
MPVMVRIRDMPETLHRRLKSRAALAGMSLSDYLLTEIRALAERPTLDDLRERLRSRAQMSVSEAPARAVRRERGQR